MPLTIAVRFLTGYCVAARSKTDPEPEWPPHPARLFMALASAWFESDRDEAELAALRWLESLGPPSLAYSGLASPARAVGTYVPANDARAVGSGGSIQTLPALRRHRAERLFPRTHLPPHDGHDVVAFLWPDAADADVARHAGALAALCARVGRLGHSSSLVQVWVERGDERRATLAPEDVRPSRRLRTVSNTSGMLDRLSAMFDRPPHRPTISLSHGYREVSAAADAEGAAGSVFDPRLEVFGLAPLDSPFRWLDIASTLQLTTALHRAVLANVQEARDAVSESISGHRPDGAPTDRPHVAYVALPFVGGDRGDGHLLGFAVVLPREGTPLRPDGILGGDVKALMKGLGLLVKNGLKLGRLGHWGVCEDVEPRPRGAMLRPDTWTAAPRGASTWASVTPVAFDEHPKARGRSAYVEEAADLVARMFERVGLPRPSSVLVTPVSRFAGSPPARDFPRLTRKDGSERRHAHVAVTFDRPVVGPVLIGAGRYRGYGLLKPVVEGRRP